jgi:hypothetical protein
MDAGHAGSGQDLAITSMKPRAEAIIPGQLLPNPLLPILLSSARQVNLPPFPGRSTESIFFGSLRQSAQPPKYRLRQFDAHVRIGMIRSQVRGGHAAVAGLSQSVGAMPCVKEKSPGVATNRGS